MIERALEELLAKAMPRAQTDVLLVRMPFPSLEYPSMALGLLKAAIADRPLDCQVMYADLFFAELIGLPAYRMLNIGDRYDMLGEWLFAGAAFPGFEPDNSRHVAHFATAFCRKFVADPTADLVAEIVDELHLLRQAATGFVQALARFIVAKRPRLVGCSSTFEQQVASIALLRAIRALDPSIVTLLGGANCEAEMGLATVRAFHWIDYVFSGEADLAFPQFCDLLLTHGSAIPTDALPFGMLDRDLAERIAARQAGGEQVAVPRAILREMDRSPVPDYADYFEQMAAMSYREQITTGMLLETSRGCWWGEKKPCTFCGLAGCGMLYRSKSPARALSDFDRVTSSYRKRRFALTDSVLDMGYFHTVLPELESRGAPYSIFCEVKANLSRARMRQLRAAGIRWCQPGIEGLHDAMLRLMNKGTGTLINVQFLKYACEFGIYPIWHLLVCFPGEDDAWHLETAAWLPLIFHLQPVQGIKPIRYDRFSAYQRHPERYGIDIVPFDCYRSIYPADEETIGQLAYYFQDADPTRQFQSGEIDRPGVQALLQREREWGAAHLSSNLKPILAMTDRGDAITILDTRPCAPQRRCTLTGAQARVYRLCEPAIRIERLIERLAEGDGPPLGETGVRSIVADLAERKLLLVIADEVLALAVEGPLPDTEHRRQFPSGDAPLPTLAGLRAERRRRSWSAIPPLD